MKLCSLVYINCPFVHMYVPLLRMLCVKKYFVIFLREYCCTEQATN